MKRITSFIIAAIFICLCFPVNLNAQTANDAVPALNDHFRYGVNPSYYAPWGNLDTTLANIAAGNPEVGVQGAGVKAFRATLPEWFINQFGNSVRTFAFEHYEKIGMDNHTVFLEGPEDDHIDLTNYCAGTPSVIFDKLYEDIWDNGENGTPVNDDNHFALYCYNVATTYGEYVKFWEIWNEPDFSSSPSAFADPGTPGNWWENDPDPCDMLIKAPIYHYIRMLRISYEVIKSVDPEAYVTTGGIGYPSFLHSILRNTDNPIDGSVNNDYPLTGGAYFDVVSFHQYPHIDNCYRIAWNNDIQDFDYRRHSDGVADCLLERKADYSDVLKEFGYDGNTYPQKLWIVTESNLPRKGIFGGPENYGNDEIQRNWIVKACVKAQMNDISQFHIYRLGEVQDYDEATFEFALMGLYKNLNASMPYTQEYTDEGMAYKTMSDELFGYKFDPALTEGLALAANVEGGAFVNDFGAYKYVLWARTSEDKSEVAQANFSFPPSFCLQDMEARNWSSSIDGSVNSVDPSNLNLTGEPVFLTPSAVVIDPEISLEQTEIIPPCFEFSSILVATVNCDSPSFLSTWFDPNGNEISNERSVQVFVGGLYKFQLLDQSNGFIMEAFLEVRDDFSVFDGSEQTDVTCFGGSDGSISVSLNPGLGFANLTWSNGMTNTLNLNGLNAGTYVLTYSGIDGCEESISFTISQPTEIQVELSITDEDQNMLGSANVSILGGLAPYTLTWLDVEGNEVDNGSLPEGTYTLLVRDANGCEHQEVFVIMNNTGNPPMEVDFTATHVLCFGDANGSINVSVSGGVEPYTFTWSNGETIANINMLVPGIYTLTITDANGQMIISSEEVFGPTQLLCEISTTDADPINNIFGTAELMVSGGTLPYTLTWIDSAGNPVDKDALDAGTYSVIITDANGCSLEKIFMIRNVASELQLELIVTNVLCFGDANGEINAVVSGGVEPYDYVWSNGSTTASIFGLAIGTYSVTVTDAANQILTASETVSGPLTEVEVVISTTDVNPASGELGSATAFASGGTPPYDFNWLDAGGNPVDNENLEAGLYTLILSDANGCETVETFEIFVTDSVEPIEVFIEQINISCAGESDGSLSVVLIEGGTPPYNYSWSNGATGATITDLSAGLYSLTVTDAAGQMAEISQELIEPEPLASSLGVLQDKLNCSAPSVSPTITSPFPPMETVELGNYTKPGDYEFTYQPEQGCPITFFFTIEEDFDAPSANAGEDLLIAYTICFGGEIVPTATLSGMGSSVGAQYEYEWSTTNGLIVSGENEFTVQVQGAGIYLLTVTDTDNGCVSFDEVEFIVEVTIIELNLSIEEISDAGSSNDQGSIDVSVTGSEGPFIYNWSNGATTQDIDMLEAGDYTLTVTDENGCQISMTFTVEAGPNSRSSITSKYDLVLFPNPSDGLIEIRTSQDIQLLDCLNLKGQQVICRKGKNQLDLSNVAAGIYFVKVQFKNGQVLYEKVIIE